MVQMPTEASGDGDFQLRSELVIIQVGKEKYVRPDAVVLGEAEQLSREVGNE